MKCSHANRIHYLGGGMWVCFRCWLAAFGLVSPSVSDTKEKSDG